MLCSRQTDWAVLPPSACRKIRIISSVLCVLPFMSMLPLGLRNTHHQTGSTNEGHAKCHKHMAPTASMFINAGDSFKNNGRTLVPERLTIALNDSKPKWPVVQTLIWDKNTTAIPEGKVKRFNSSYEEIIWCV